MVFGSIIPLVCGSRGPVESELALGYAATEPPHTHVHGFYALGYGGEVGDANSSSVVSLQRRLGLRSSHFNEGVAQGDHFLCCNI